MVPSTAPRGAVGPRTRRAVSDSRPWEQPGQFPPPAGLIEGGHRHGTARVPGRGPNNRWYDYLPRALVLSRTCAVSQRRKDDHRARGRRCDSGMSGPWARLVRDEWVTEDVPTGRSILTAHAPARTLDCDGRAHTRHAVPRQEEASRGKLPHPTAGTPTAASAPAPLPRPAGERTPRRGHPRHVALLVALASILVPYTGYNGLVSWRSRAVVGRRCGTIPWRRKSVRIGRGRGAC